MENFVRHAFQLVNACRQVVSDESFAAESSDFVIYALENLISRLSLTQHEVEVDFQADILELLEEALINVEIIQHNMGLSKRCGRPKIEIPVESIQELLSLKFTVVSIASMYSVSRKTIFRRMKEMNISVKTSYSPLTNDELQMTIERILLRHPNTGYKRMLGFLSAEGHRVKEYDVREAMRIVDPFGVAQRSAENRAIYRRVYFVRYSMERWHLDTNMKLNRYKMIIRSCVDGNSRCCVYVNVGGDNTAISTLNSFKEGVDKYGVPQGIRCDKGNENRAVSRFMLTLRGTGKSTVLTGRSTHNQRIERFWGDLYRDVGFYYNVFQCMEENGIIDLNEPNSLFVLHYVFLPRLQRCLDEFINGWNHHKVSTGRNRTPFQMMIVNRPPEEKKCPFDEATVMEVYNYCLGLPLDVDEEYHPVRNPSPINHTLSQQQLLQLSEVDVLQESSNFGIDVITRCLDIINQIPIQ